MIVLSVKPKFAGLILYCRRNACANGYTVQRGAYRGNKPFVMSYLQSHSAVPKLSSVLYFDLFVSLSTLSPVAQTAAPCAAHVRASTPPGLRHTSQCRCGCHRR